MRDDTVTPGEMEHLVATLMQTGALAYRGRKSEGYRESMHELSDDDVPADDFETRVTPAPPDEYFSDDEPAAEASAPPSSRVSKPRPSARESAPVVPSEPRASAPAPSGFMMTLLIKLHRYMENTALNLSLRVGKARNKIGVRLKRVADVP